MQKPVAALTVALFAFLLIACPADAKRQRQSKKILPGHVAKSNINQVTSNITWHTNLSKAKKVARAENKMIVWIQMIGKMDGAT